MDIKKTIFKHIEKVVFALTICYFVFTIYNTFIVRGVETNHISTKLKITSRTIEAKLRDGKPPEPETQFAYAEQFKSRITTPPEVELLENIHIFNAKGSDIQDITLTDLVKNLESQKYPHLMESIPGDTEFIYKGGTPDLALITVRKQKNEKWTEESFTVGKGMAIGGEKLINQRKIDFFTKCKLLDIDPEAQKPLVLQKSSIVTNEEGDFVGTSIVDEIEMIATPNIKYEDKRGDVYYLWIGELVNLGTETEHMQGNGLGEIAERSEIGRTEASLTGKVHNQVKSYMKKGKSRISAKF